VIVRLDPASPASPAEQLVTQVAAAIRGGEVQPGTRLPTIRGLAADLGLAPGTVARAYAELERDGWVHAQGRRGTVVAERRVGRDDEAIARAAEDLAALVGDNPDAAGIARRALDVAFARIARTS
jgi:DNA-binding transcriptional regulator YhcF (GntR family)